MQITAINTTIMFIDDETNHKHHKSKVLTKPEITPVAKPETKPATTQAEEKPKLQEPLKQDTVEIKKSAKAEPNCEGENCKKV